MDFKNPLLIWLGRDLLISENTTVNDLSDLINSSEELLLSKLDNLGYDLDKIVKISNLILNLNLKLAEKVSKLNPLFSYELGSGLGIPSFYLKKNNQNHVNTIDYDPKTSTLIKALFHHYGVYFCHHQMDLNNFNPSMELNLNSKKESLIVMSRSDSTLSEVKALKLAIENQMSFALIPFVQIQTKNEVYCRLGQYKKLCERNNYSFNIELIKDFEPYHIVIAKPS
jgi:hypothetical protein